MQTLNIKIVDDPSKAPNYAEDTPDVRTVVIHTVVVVGKGTVNGKATVDFNIRDLEGNEYVAMLTGALVQQLALAIKGVEQRR